MIIVRRFLIVHFISSGNFNDARHQWPINLAWVQSRKQIPKLCRNWKCDIYKNSVENVKFIAWNLNEGSKNASDRMITDVNLSKKMLQSQFLELPWKKKTEIGINELFRHAFIYNNRLRLRLSHPISFALKTSIRVFFFSQLQFIIHNHFTTPFPQLETYTKR